MLVLTRKCNSTESVTISPLGLEAQSVVDLLTQLLAEVEELGYDEAISGRLYQDLVGRLRAASSVKLTVGEFERGKVRLYWDADPQVKIWRSELLDSKPPAAG